MSGRRRGTRQGWERENRDGKERKRKRERESERERQGWERKIERVTRVRERER